MRPLARALVLGAVSLSACHRGDPKRDDVTKSRSPKDALECPLPSDGRVTQPLTLPAGCKAKVAGAGVVVSDGGALEIEAGVELSFAPEGQLVVRGGAVHARGTQQAPIVLSASSKRWRGVVLEKGKGSRLERVEVRDVGAEPDTAQLPRAAIEIQAEAEATSLANVRVRHCQPASLSVGGGPPVPGAPSESGLASAEGLDFDAPENKGRASIVIGASALGAVASAHVTAPVVLSEPLVTGPVTWPKLDAPIVAPTGLMLAGNGTGPRTVLRLAEGTTLLVGRGHRIFVGDVGPASLVAHRVRFDSAEARPTAGDWPGIQLRDAFGSEIVDCTIAHAGAPPAPTAKPSSPLGIIDVRVRSVPKLLRTKFVDDVGFAIVSYDGCASLTAPENGNDFGMLSPCHDAKASLAAQLSELDLKLLGALSGNGTGTRSVPSDSAEGGSVLSGPVPAGSPGAGGPRVGGGDVRRGGTAPPSP